MSKKVFGKFGWLIALVLVLSLCLCACQKPDAGTPTSDPNTSTEDTSKKEVDLTGRKLVTFGTSITYGQGSTINYGGEIASRNDMEHTNYAVGGASAMKTLSIYTSKKDLEPMKSLTADDFVIFEGLFNNYSKPKGALTPAGTTTFDTETVYGALEQTIYDYLQSGCPAKVGYILTHYGKDTANPENYGPIWNIAVDVCAKYSIPLLDLRYKPYELNNDKVHLTMAGQLAMSEDVEAWLKTL